MRKLWNLLSYFWHARKCWRWPKQSDVLIFDACHQQLLLEYLHPWKPEVLHVRGEQINMPVLVASLFKNGRKVDAYIDCFIERVRPRLVVTMIDNRPDFWTISQKHPGVKTVFVQNGWRTYFGDVSETLDKVDTLRHRKLQVDYMLTFGAMNGAEYARYISGTVVPIGSIKNNLIPPTHSAQPDMIAFISQWRNEGLYLGDEYCSQEAFFGQADRCILKCLARYAHKKNKRLAIILTNGARGKLRSQEEDYFRELLGHEGEFLELQGPYPSYRAVDAAEVVVAVDSTLGYESIARGTRTAIFCIRGSLLGVPGRTYGWPGNLPAEGPFWTNRPDPEAFERILDHLFEIDDAQWRKDIETTNFSSLMIYNRGNSIFKSILEKELGDPEFGSRQSGSRESGRERNSGGAQADHMPNETVTELT